MKTKRICFPRTEQAVVMEFEIDGTPCEYELFVKSLYSIISAGTEGAGFAGLSSGRHVVAYPQYPGYGNVGKVLAIGDKVDDYKVGDVIFSTAQHSSYYKIDTRYDFEKRSRFVMKVPDDLDPLKAVFARMADVAMSAIRKADFGLGDTVLVIGLGLVGNFAAQLFQLAGAEVMGADMVDFRLDRAKQCGVKRTVNSGKWDDLTKAVMDWTDGKGAQIVVEAIGLSSVIAQAVQLARPHGEVILLGSPRGEAVMDVTPMLSTIHVRHVTIKGALEWLWSVTESPLYFPSRNSKIGNLKQIFSLLKSGTLVTEPLLTHLLPPEKCQEAYEGLVGGIKGTLKTAYLGVVYDWR